MNIECVRVPVIYRVNQAEYVMHILVAASQEYVNTYSTRLRHSLLAPQACVASEVNPVVVLGCGFSCARVAL